MQTKILSTSKGNTTLALHNKQGGWYFAPLSNLKQLVGAALHVLLVALGHNPYLKRFVGRWLKSRQVTNRPVLLFTGQDNFNKKGNLRTKGSTAQ